MMDLKAAVFSGMVFLVLFLTGGCKKDPPVIADNCAQPPCDTVAFVYDPTPYPLDFPDYIPPMEIPDSSPLTVKAVELGRRLFYDPILSGDSTQACASCHAQPFGFTDHNRRFSIGIDGIEGTRNAMAIINLGWARDFFWDGRAKSLEDQAKEPVPNPIEMHEEWPDAIEKLQRHPEYPRLFGEAYNTTRITQALVVKAIASFERTLISFNSKYDRVYRGEAFFTESELNGFEIFMTERGDCFHCHGAPFFTDHLFHNNGLDSVFTDPGLAGITGNPNDRGKFKTPTLRNIALTAPYMHDGRFATLDEVIEHYNSGGHPSPTIDPLMKNVGVGLQLTEQEKQDLKAFLLTLTDDDFINNPDYSSPFE